MLCILCEVTYRVDQALVTTVAHCMGSACRLDFSVKQLASVLNLFSSLCCGCFTAVPHHDCTDALLRCCTAQVDVFLSCCVALFGDTWPLLLSPSRCVQLLQGLTAAHAPPRDLLIKVGTQGSGFRVWLRVKGSGCGTWFRVWHKVQGSGLAHG